MARREIAAMDNQQFGHFTCDTHDLPLDETWQCPDENCRLAHCPVCGRTEHDRCEHLFYTVGECVYYGPDGLESEEFPGADFYEYSEAVLLEAFPDEPELASRLHDDGDPLRILCDMASERIQGPKVVSQAGGWWPGSDCWSNTWVLDMAEALGKFRPLVECYFAGLQYLKQLEDDQDA